jgi:hypothetical protein
MTALPLYLVEAIAKALAELDHGGKPTLNDYDRAEHIALAVVRYQAEEGQP